jgi:hypothetical protein
MGEPMIRGFPCDRFSPIFSDRDRGFCLFSPPCLSDSVVNPIFPLTFRAHADNFSRLFPEEIPWRES